VDLCISLVGRWFLVVICIDVVLFLKVLMMVCRCLIVVVLLQVAFMWLLFMCYRLTLEVNAVVIMLFDCFGI